MALSPGRGREPTSLPTGMHVISCIITSTAGCRAADYRTVSLAAFLMALTGLLGLSFKELLLIYSVSDITIYLSPTVFNNIKCF